MMQSKKTIFISDLHLDNNTPELTQLFLNVLRSQKPSIVDAIYILGDLFESWIGDEEITHHHDIIQGLAGATNTGLPIYFLPGNRDFLIGTKFLQATGCQLLAEETRIHIYGTPVLLVHGDALCTNDVSYLRAKKYLRSNYLQTLFLSLPFFVRKKIAYKIRIKSQQHTTATSSEIMDVTEEEVQKTMCQHQVLCLIHGHTHRPGIHAFSLEEQPAVRIVLGAWHQGGSMLVWHESGHKELIDVLQYLK